MTKYILYARKSSEPDDRQILSVDSQIKELKDLAKKNNLKIVEIMTESKSAKEPGRPIFNRLITAINGGRANGIICWKLDRLARNPVDGGNISWMLQQGIVQSIQTFGKEYKPTDNVLLMNVEFGMANQFIRDLSVNTKRGLKVKLEQGWLPAVAPIGYLNDRNTNTIIPDLDRFDIVKKMWKYMETGRYTVKKVLDIADKEWGLKTIQRKRSGGKALSISGVHTVFTNIFYTGKFEYNGEIYNGSHKPMISEDMYWKVQKILGNKGKPHPKTHEFAFTGLIRCAECGCMITAEDKHKRLKNGEFREYTYYRCTKKKKVNKCKQPFIRVENLESQIVEVLNKLSIDDDFLQLALDYLRDENKKESKMSEKNYKNTQKQYNDIQKQLSNLVEMRTKELVNDNEYQTMKEKITSDREQIKDRLGKLENRSNDWLELTEKTFSFANQVKERFEKGTLNDKRIILQTIGSNLILDNKKLYIKPVKPFDIIINRDKNTTWLRSSDSNREPSR